MRRIAHAFRGARRFAGARPGMTDAVIASALALGGLTGLWALEGFLAVPLATASLVALLLYLPLALRRRFPLAALLAHTVVFVAYGFLMLPEGLFSSMALFVAVYSAGAYGAERWRDWARGVSVSVLSLQVVWVLVTVEATDLVVEGQPEVNLGVYSLFAVLLNVFFFVAAWVLGDTMRERRENAAALAERAAQLEAERAENARRAVLDERLRIARELHDVVAHHVSVMGVQAGAARRLAQRDPEQASQALGAVEEASRQAVGELQQLLGFLRASDEREPLDAKAAPQPSLGALRDLVQQVGDGPVDVALTVEGEAREVPAGVQLSAYRIVQEALTNTLKHAHARKAEVIVRYEPDAVAVEVLDDGNGGGGRGGGELGGVGRGVDGRPGEFDDVDGSGLGLVGMRERAALHGGDLRVGPRPGGGFSVAARLPTGKEVAAQ